MKRVAVIGGGWAGCAAAVELARRGAPVTLFEAARNLGGRARMVELNGRKLDNGQHILLGAYADTLRLLETVGLSVSDVLLRLPLQMRYPPQAGGMDFVTPRLPAPWHMLAGLIRAKGLQREDKLALARFSTTARWMDWRLNNDCSVNEMLERFDQTDRLIQLMWRPLCIAALNTPPERASAQVFLNVLRDSLGARRSASDMLIPRVDLSALFPARAAAFIERHAGSVHCGAAVRRIVASSNGWQLETGDPETEDGFQYDAVIVATSAWQAASLLAGHADVAALSSFSHEPITTCFLQYPPQVRLAHPLLALIDDARKEHWGQFVFDRGHLDAEQAGLLAVVVSASGDAITHGHEALSSAVAGQLAEVLRRPELASPSWSKVISEKRATFACTPGLQRPANETGINGLVLAGDYTASDYPATLEAAVRSGLRAALLALGS
ncbi:hydroxysqualene dehydroxylase HpnE [Noviherbaspirillum aerium]|uniref:hydroxysqualene dehydroxylase HpnE n=1 Tax=Noviherbaspirillum aerium TaxID=2588497 RepID=UPI00124E0265|nr:hydroxysqualene dehydroxylase HpnE [Noviherbaspirillum aerium]